MQQHSPFAEHLADTGLRDCFDFWLSRRQGQRPPDKRAIDATRIPRAIIPNLFLYELTAENRFKCRLAGSAIREAFGREPTGHFLDELVDPASTSDRTALFRATLDRQLPVVYGGRIAEGEKRWISFKRLLLPVNDDRGSSRFVFGMVMFVSNDEANDRRFNTASSTYRFESWATEADIAISQ